MLQNVIILLIVSAVMCSIGFYKHVYFLSIGYGFSVAGIGAALLIMYASSLNIFSVLQCIVLILYGARLAGFLLYRELKNAAYRSTLKSVAKDESDMSFAAKFGIWAGVAILYVMETSPVFFRLANGTQDTAAPVIGICISLFGLFMEAAADHQKSEQKKENPHMAAMKGLYRIVRCPNYFGEILFWTWCHGRRSDFITWGSAVDHCINSVCNDHRHHDQRCSPSGETAEQQLWQRSCLPGLYS